MTLSGSLDNYAGEASPAPKLFGISFTPKVLGIIFGLVGVGVAAYVGTTMIMPKFEEMSQLSASIEEKEGKLEQTQQTIAQINEIKARLAKAQAQNREVRGLFSTQAALDTLLLDLNRVITQNGANMLKFEPDYAASGIVNDSSIGPELNGKLRRQVTTVSFEGSFSETLTILQKIDQLQTLLVIQGYNTEVKDQRQRGRGGEPVIVADPLTSSFKLIAYIPLTQEELLANPPAAAPDASGKPGKPGKPGAAAPNSN
jgi:type IV pilus assembly protein PilO